MNTSASQLYDFVFRGFLAEEALDRQGRKNRRLLDVSDDALAKALSLDLLDDVHVANAQATAAVYSAIAAFENGVRALVTKTLIEKFHEEWWEKGASTAFENVLKRGWKRSSSPSGTLNEARIRLITRLSVI